MYLKTYVPPFANKNIFAHKLALVNNFVMTKKFLNAKFDRTIYADVGGRVGLKQAKSMLTYFMYGPLRVLCNTEKKFNASFSIVCMS